MRWLWPLVPFLFTGCAFFNEVNRLGADLDFGLGGILAEAIDVRLKASVAVERGGADEKADAPGAGGGDRGFL